jgi:DNA-binding CsgD family transcriptional regulator
MAEPGPGDRLEVVDVLERGAFSDQLDDLLMEASRGRGRLVMIRGEAGIGKSTLVEAFANGRSGRVWVGACDPVVPPRPLAPVLDMAERLGGAVSEAVAAGDQHGIANAFLSLLRSDGGPRVLVFEDLQWADDPTLELVRVVARRLAQLPALVIGTVRDEEVTAGHPLSVALGDIPPAVVTTLQLPPLSVDAVRILAEGSGLDADALHAAAGGNPFFVTEVVTAGTTELPSSIRDAVWARARRLSDHALRLTHTAAVLGPRCELALLTAVSGTDATGLNECVSRGMLRATDGFVEFRHDLAHRAMLDALDPAERVALEGRVLAALLTTPGANAGRIARHATAAGDATSVLTYAPRAAEEAAAVGAHRAARAFYSAALPFSASLTGPERASLLATYAHECFVLDELRDAVVNQEAAIECWRAAGDVAGEGQGLSDLAYYLYWFKEIVRARDVATRAVELLDSLSAGPPLARAYARLAQLHLVVGENQAAFEWGGRALALAEELGEEPVMIHALNTVGCAEGNQGIEGGWDKVEESLRRARQANLEDDTTRGFNNLIAMAREHRRYDVLDRAVEGLDLFAAQRDLDQTLNCLIGDVAESDFDRGFWDKAERRAQQVLDRDQLSGCTQCFRVLGRLAARRGTGDPFPLLQRALELMTGMGMQSEFTLSHAALAEAHWLAEDYRAAGNEVEKGMASTNFVANSWQIGELLYWAWKLDLPCDWPDSLPEPYAHQLDGHPDKAAAAWAALGCPYEEARALLDSDNEADLRRALDTFLSLRANPAASLATKRLKDLGARGIPRGPRSTTSGNPCGLSAREIEVVVLLADRLTNRDIATRLVVSTKTVDHHVSAVLAKLGVSNRHEVPRRAAELGITN